MVSLNGSWNPVQIPPAMRGRDGGVDLGVMPRRGGDGKQIFSGPFGQNIHDILRITRIIA